MNFKVVKQTLSDTKSDSSLTSRASIELESRIKVSRLVMNIFPPTFNLIYEMKTNRK
jgi:hypothetical protein